MRRDQSRPAASRRRRALLAACAMVALTSCGGEDPVAQGSLTVTGGGIYEESAEGGCGGNNESNRQFRGGLPVVVYDAAGEVLGSGSLENGRVTNPGMFCVLPFSFPLSGSDENYQIEFGGDGQRTVVQDIEAVDLCFGPRC